MSKEEKDALLENFAQIKSDNFHLRRDTPRARIQDVANTVRNVRMLVRTMLHYV